MTRSILQCHAHLPPIIGTKPLTKATHTNCLPKGVTFSCFGLSQNPNTHIQPLPMTVGPQPSPGSYTPNNGPQNKQVPSFVAPQAASSIAAPCPAVAGWQPWMSPYAYEVVLLPTIVKRSYGCGSNFVERYRSLPHSLVVKHMDRRIAGKDSLGQLN